MKIYDITVALSPAIPVYPGDPAFQKNEIASLAAGDVCTVSHLSFGSHTGTHVDPPAHFVAGAMTLDELPLEILLGKARVFEVGEIAVIDLAFVQNADLAGVTRVLFKTRNSKLWQQGAHEFTKDFVYLATDAAEFLVAAGVQLVGIDYLSIEQFDFAQPTTHYALLRNNVIIVEGLNLSAVTAGDYELICLPLKIQQGDGAPARVVLRELI